MVLRPQVDDAPTWFRRAIEAGAAPLMPPQDIFRGDRCDTLRDPLGFAWSAASLVRPAQR